MKVKGQSLRLFNLMIVLFCSAIGVVESSLAIAGAIVLSESHKAKPINVTNIKPDNDIAPSVTHQNSLNETRPINSELNTWPEEPIMLYFEDAPLSTLVSIVFDFANKELLGVSKLDKYLVDIDVRGALASDVAEVLLRCHGYEMKDKGEYFK